MPSQIRWGSLVTDINGEIDYARVRNFVAVVLAALGGTLAISREVFIGIGLHVPAGDNLAIIITSLVLPVTGGTVAGVLMKRSNGVPK